MASYSGVKHSYDIYDDDAMRRAVASMGHKDTALALQQLEEAIEQHEPKSDCTAYKNALAKCPRIVDKESNRVRFLQACYFDCKQAASKLINYWKLRLETFGEERCYLSVTDLEGSGSLNPKALKLVDTGFGYLLPPDKQNRTVLAIDRIKYTPKIRAKMGTTVEDTNEALFYYVQLVLEEDASVAHGFVVVHLLCENSPKMYPAANIFFARATKHCLPVKLRSGHMICAPPANKKLSLFATAVMPFLWQFWTQFYSWIPRRTIDFVYARAGEQLEEKVAALLTNKIGLRKGGLPAVAGGECTYPKFESWYFERRKESLADVPIVVDEASPPTLNLAGSSALWNANAATTASSPLDLLAAAAAGEMIEEGNRSNERGKDDEDSQSPRKRCRTQDDE